MPMRALVLARSLREEMGADRRWLVRKDICREGGAGECGMVSGLSRGGC